MNNSDTIVEARARLVAWRINRFDASKSDITSKEFKIGKWFWHIELRQCKKTMMIVAILKPIDKSCCTKSILPVPIATVIQSVCYPPGCQNFKICRLIYNRKISYEHGNKFAVVKGTIHGITPITICFEFLNLGATRDADGKVYSIWDDEYSELNSSNEPLSRMLSESIYTDIVINVTNGSIEAHRAVLAANSPVFKAMFSENYREKETSAINIVDMSIGACKAMLNFLYGKRQRSELRAHMTELILAADKYDIANLKKACEASMCEDVGIGNVFKRLKYAFTYDLRDLKATCLFYLTKMGTMFELQADYISFLQEVDTEIIVEVTNAFLDAW